MRTSRRKPARLPRHAGGDDGPASALHQARLHAVHDSLLASGAETVLDLGCGSGTLLARLACQPRFRHIVGIDVSVSALRTAERRLAPRGPSDVPRIRLLHASFTEPDPDLTGFDAAVLVETIEHIERDRLSSVERTVFACYRPKTVIITTPNSECNDLLGVPKHRLRDRDHRFEWTRGQFRSWAAGVAGRNRYDVTFEDVGWTHPTFGGPTQMATFALRRKETWQTRPRT